MTISDLQRHAKNGERFVALTIKGTRLTCRWVNVRKGLFEVEEMGGRPVEDRCLCDLSGAPNSPVIEVEGLTV